MRNRAPVTADQRREIDVIEDVRETLEAALTYFIQRGSTIIATNIKCQLEYFESAVAFDKMDDAAPEGGLIS